MHRKQRFFLQVAGNMFRKSYFLNMISSRADRARVVGVGYPDQARRKRLVDHPGHLRGIARVDAQVQW